MKRLQPLAWMLAITGCCFLISSVLIYSDFVVRLETGFFSRILEYTPGKQQHVLQPLAFSPHMQLFLNLSLFGLLSGWLLYRGRNRPSAVLMILLIFVMLMTEVLVALFGQIWIPLLWPMMAIAVTALLLNFRTYLLGFVSTLKLNEHYMPRCQIETIRELIESKDYGKAVILFRHCEYNEEMLELAYHLGQELEQQQEWILARMLYVWLTEYDPGMQDFVDSMEHKINPMLDQDLSTSEITQNKDQFSHYQLVGKKALGATAAVYEAFDLYTHRRIALKILNRNMSVVKADEDSTEDREVMAFLHEAMTISKLDHPNIVKIHDADIHDDKAYIAMDYIAGYPMSERLRRKQYISAGETLRILNSVLGALEFAHQKGIVHGDIKPANIMYDQHKKIYILTDFGAARSASHLLDSEKHIIGTPAYMSPEQLNGSKIDGRSDLYSLAVTLYHLSTGIQPFSDDELSQLKKKVINTQANMDLLSLPEGVKKILDKAMQKKTYHRFADANQMLQAVSYCQTRLSKKI